MSRYPEIQRWQKKKQHREPISKDTYRKNIKRQQHGKNARLYIAEGKKGADDEDGQDRNL